MISEKKIKVEFVKDTDDKGHIPDGQFTLIYDKIPGGGGGGIDVDDQLSLTSENPVQNKVITAKINEIAGEIGTIETELEGI